jgi:hypothetical protein
MKGGKEEEACPLLAAILNFENDTIRARKFR